MLNHSRHATLCLTGSRYDEPVLLVNDETKILTSVAHFGCIISYFNPESP
jgi:hypothetical protein